MIYPMKLIILKNKYMAAVTLNPVLLSIHGRIGNTVFYHNRGKTCARQHVIPRNPDTKVQRIVRQTFANAIKVWQSMDQDKRYKFNRKVRNLCMSGYNLFISEYMKTMISNKTNESSWQTTIAGQYMYAFQKRITSVSYSIINKNAENTHFMPIQISPG
jgi:hypothetical protein